MAFGLKTGSKSTARPKGRKTALLIGLLLTLLVFLLWVFDAFAMLELGSVNWRFRLRGPKPAVAPAVIVAIDDESLNGWTDDKGAYQGMPDRWTWPRTVYAKAVENLSRAGAKVIVFDMVFSESSRLDPRQDEAFAAAARKAGNVVFGVRFSDTFNERFKSHKLETLIPGLAAAAADMGVVHAETDADQVMRHLPMTDVERTDLPNLDVAVYRRLLFGKAEPFTINRDSSELIIGDNHVPLVDGYKLAINYTGPARTFPTFPFHHVYFGTMDMAAFKDKVVYIGSTTEILHDNWPTPFEPVVKTPGVEIHANALDTLLSRDYLRKSPPWVEVLLLIGLGVLATFVTFKLRSWQGALAVAGLALAYLSVVVLSFLRANWVLPLASPLASMFVSFAGITAWRLTIEERRSREIRTQFSRYVSRAIVDEILKDPTKIKLGGSQKEVTILFSDVRGFTAMSERLTAEEVVSILNEYLTAMVDIVIEHEGTLDKYVGDAIMAVWGSPLPDPEHQRKAVTCAVRMMDKLQELRRKWAAEGKPPIDIGIGLNTGHVVAGNMGHLHYKMDYTVIGDDVNLAARLESANKDVKSHILISESTYNGSEDLVEVVQHPPIKVKGKEKPVNIYEVVGWKGAHAEWAKPLQ